MRPVYDSTTGCSTTVLHQRKQCKQTPSDAPLQSHRFGLSDSIPLYTGSILEGDMSVNSSKANYPKTSGASALSLSHALGGQLYYKSLLGRLPICCIINSLPRPPTTGISRKTEDEKLTKRHARFALSKHTYRSMFWSTATVRLRFGVVALNITPCTHSAARKHDVVYTRYPQPKGDASIYCCC